MFGQVFGSPARPCHALPTMRLSSAFALISSVSFGCAPRGAPPATPLLAPAPTVTTQDLPETPDEAAATYDALVQQAQAAEGEAQGDNACLIEHRGELLRFTGVPSPAVRPLPRPRTDLDPALAQSPQVNILTGSGRYGQGVSALNFAAFTYTPPTREALLLAVTDLGIYVRPVRDGSAAGDRLAHDAAVQAVELLQPATVFVAAEAGVSTIPLAELLEALLGQRIPVALAVDLPSGTVLPEPFAGRAGELCPEGLPETESPEGALSSAQLAVPVAQLKSRSSACLGSADARGAAGGRLRLMLRVSADGAVEQACVSADDTDDALLRACLVSEATKLRFPQPSPPGSVDLELPLTLEPRPAPPPELLCAAPLSER